MFTPQDIRPLSAAVGSAAAIGLALGLWLTLPPALSAREAAADPEPVSQVDPNLAQYRQMIAANGVDATPYILAAGYEPAPPPSAVFAAPSNETATAAPDSTPMIAADQDSPPQPQAERIAWIAAPQPAESIHADADSDTAQPAAAGQAWVSVASR